MESRFAQTVDSTYYIRLPCGAPRSVSCLCFNATIIAEPTGKVNSRRGFFHGSKPQKTDGSLCFFAQMHEKTHVFRANAARSGSTRTERRKEGAPQPIFRARLTAELRSGCRAMGASEPPCARREILRERPAGAAFPSLDRDAGFPARGQDSRVPARPLRTPGRLSGRKAASCR